MGANRIIPGRVRQRSTILRLSTGAIIVAGFISGLVNPKEVLLSGNTLYVSIPRQIWSELTTRPPAPPSISPNFYITERLSAPGEIPSAFRQPPCSSRNSGTAGNVGAYNASTGATINASFINPGGGASFGLELVGSTLLVGRNGTAVSQYSASTAQLLNPTFVGGPPMARKASASPATAFPLRGR